jgi:hypothetical protein
MLDNIKDNVNSEIDEIQRVVQHLNREEDIDISVDDLTELFINSEETTLTDDIWEKLENTESNEVNKGDFKTVIDIAKTYNKTDPKLLSKSLKKGDYKRPLIVSFNDRYHLVAGNTRLSTAASLGINPKVHIVYINDMNDTKKIEAKEMTGADSSGSFESAFSGKPIKRKIDKIHNINENTIKDLVGKKFRYVIGSGTESNIDFNDDEYVLRNLGRIIKVNLFDGEFYFNWTDTDEKILYKEIFNDDIIEPLIKNIDKTLEKYFVINKDKNTVSWSLSNEQNRKIIDNFFLKNKKISDTLRNDYIEYRKEYFWVDLTGGDGKETEMKEATLADSSGQYDVSFSAGRKDPLSIEGEKSIKKSRAVKDKNFPKWGGPGSVFVKVKDKCKKFPYCNQGDIKSLEMFEIEGLKEAIETVSRKHNVPIKNIEDVVLEEIKKII